MARRTIELLAVYAALYRLLVLHSHGLATRGEALRVRDQLEQLAREGYTTDPLLADATRVLTTARPWTVTYAWLGPAAAGVGDPDVEVVIDQPEGLVSLIAAAPVWPSRLGQVADTHLDVEQRRAYATARHAHTTRVEHAHHERVHLDLEAATMAAASDPGSQLLRRRLRQLCGDHDPVGAWLPGPTPPTM